MLSNISYIMEKEDNSTMITAQEEEEEEEKEGELHQQFKHLEKDWDSFKQSNPHRLHRCSSTELKEEKNNDQLDSSPRGLNFSLEHKQDALEGEWKVRTNDLAVEEILSDRRAAIESGKLKGRRLFDAMEGSSEMGSSGLIQGVEVRSLCSYTSPSSSSSSSSAHGDDNDSDHGDDNDVGGYDDKSVGSECYSSSTPSKSIKNVEKEEDVVLEREKVAVVGVEDKRFNSVGRGKWMTIIGWISMVMMIFALGIISIRSFDGYGDDDGETLIPT